VSASSCFGLGFAHWDLSETETSAGIGIKSRLRLSAHIDQNPLQRGTQWSKRPDWPLGENTMEKSSTEAVLKGKLRVRGGLSRNVGNLLYKVLLERVVD
jgi:hypothetical protein